MSGMTLSVEQYSRVLRLTLNRPDKRNALNRELCSRIVQTVTSAQHDRNIGVVLICANGRVFSAGMDLDEAVQPNAGDLAEIHDKLFSLGATARKPIVVCANGAALGGGLGLVAQGHVVVAAQSAVFGLTEIRLGLWPFLVYRAVESALGSRRTLELSLTGRIFSAENAFDWGIVHQVCPPGEVADRAAAVARDLAKASSAAVAAGMQYVRDSRGKSWNEAGELAASLRAGLMESDDFKEGVAAFREKRDPHWPSIPQEFYAGHHQKNSNAHSTGKAINDSDE